jgi:hypothetical protein
MRRLLYTRRMESANVTLPDLDQLNVTELKTLLREQHAELLSKDEELLLHKAELVRQDKLGGTHR